MMSANFRAIFHLQYNQWAKHAKSPSQLWPLSIDDKGLQLSEEEMYERNKRITEWFNSKQKGEA